jgi:hypothetical protein
MAGSGKAGALFMDTNCGARPAALAGQYTARTSDASCIWYNPAGLADITSGQGVFTFSRGFMLDSNSYIAAAYPFDGLGVFSALAAVNGNEPIDNAIDGQPAVTVSDQVYMAGYARSVGAGFALGASAKYYRSVIGLYNAASVSFDGGLVYAAENGIKAGLSLKNIGTPLKYNSDNTPVPAEAAAGINAELLRGKEHELSAGLDIKYGLVDGGVLLSVGAEYIFNGFLSARLGYLTDQDRVQGISAGAGISLPVSQTLLRIDYALTPRIWGEGDATFDHIFTLAAAF